MRTALRPFLGKKSVWSATVKRFGWRRFRGDYVGKTLLLVDLKDAGGNLVADHLWMKIGKRLEKLSLKPGDVIRFNARVDVYTRGGRDSDDYDYHLEYPDRVFKVDPQSLAREGQTLLA